MELKEYRQFVNSFDRRLIEYGSLHMSKKEFYKYLNDIMCYEIYLNESAKITKAEKLRSKIVQDRQLEVLYITGSSGSGKTTAAKYLAQKLNYDYFVSGSGDDFLDGYDMEECIILDDFRSGSMKFSELLKFLDNNTNSSVKSRYYNKDISNCKLIIITSVFPPDQLYYNTFHNKETEEKIEEPIEQFFRRIKHHYLKIQSNGDLEDFKTTIDIDPISKNRILTNINDIYKELNIIPNSKVENSIFDSMYQEIDFGSLEF